MKTKNHGIRWTNLRWWHLVFMVSYCRKCRDALSAFVLYPRRDGLEKNVSTMGFFGSNYTVAQLPFCVLIWQTWFLGSIDKSNPQISVFDVFSEVFMYILWCLGWGETRQQKHRENKKQLSSKRKFAEKNPRRSQANTHPRLLFSTFFGGLYTWIAESTQKEDLIWVPLSGWYLWQLNPPLGGFGAKIFGNKSPPYQSQWLIIKCKLIFWGTCRAPSKPHRPPEVKEVPPGTARNVALSCESTGAATPKKL